MTRLRQLLTAGDDGVTLVELTVAFFMLSIIAAVMINWMIQVSQADEFEQQSAVALEEMRYAKSQLTKELRFAESIDVASSDAHAVKVWVDEDGDASAQPAELVTWWFAADGTLMRDTDSALDVPERRASNLVYDAAAAAGSSRFSYDAAYEVVTIELVSDVDTATGPEAKSIHTEVHLRN